MTSQRHLLAALVAVSLGGLAGTSPAFAANDASNSAAHRITLARAIADAERESHGKAGKAELERDAQGRWVYDVEVRTSSGVLDVAVDAQTGAVLSMKPDTEDDDDAHDERD